MKARRENQLFNVVLTQSKIDRLQYATLGKLLAKNHLTLPEWLVLGIVKQAKKKGLSMTAVATAADMSGSQITVISNTLLSRHLLRQKTQEVDKRSRNLIITDKGARLHTRATTTLSGLSRELGKAMGNQQAKYITLSENFAHVLRDYSLQKDE